MYTFNAQKHKLFRSLSVLVIENEVTEFCSYKAFDTLEDSGSSILSYRSHAGWGVFYCVPEKSIVFEIINENFKFEYFSIQQIIVERVYSISSVFLR
jgi:hypothetical protein